MFDWNVISTATTPTTVLAYFIYQYFQTKKVEDTLKLKEVEKKDGTDEVAMKLGDKDSVAVELERRKNEIDNLSSLLKAHEESNKESFGVIHNGLNTLGQNLKDTNTISEDKLTVTIANPNPATRTPWLCSFRP